MTNHDELAEQIEKKTDRILKMSGLMFLTWQISFFTIFNQHPDHLRTVDIVARAGYLAWACALLMLIATGGGWYGNADVRAILDDELARAHRASAYRNAFWTVIAVSLVAYVSTHVIDIPAQVIAHIVLSAGVLVAVGTLVFLRRQ
jgi:hypothetical protein